MPTIEIDLNDFLYAGGSGPEDPASLRDLVINTVVQQLVEDFRRTEINKEIGRQVREVVHANIDATVRTALAQPIQPSSRWGEKQGEPTTVLEMARLRLEALLNTPANRTGSYHNDKAGNLAELIDDVVKKELTTGELRKTLDEAKKTVAAKVEQVMRDYVAQALVAGRR